MAFGDGLGGVEVAVGEIDGVGAQAVDDFDA